jgi:hypothetical protein
MPWFISDEGDTRGPYSPSEVQREIEAGRIREGMRVREREGQWERIEDSQFGEHFKDPRGLSLSAKQQIFRVVVLSVAAAAVVAYCGRSSGSAGGAASGSSPQVRGRDFDSMHECLQGIRSASGLDLRPVVDKPDKVSGYLGTTDRDFACTKESTGTRVVQWQGWYEE